MDEIGSENPISYTKQTQVAEDIEAIEETVTYFAVEFGRAVFSFEFAREKEEY